MMNIVTIFQYDIKNINNLIMLYMFVDSLKKYCITYPYTLWIITQHEDILDQIFTDTNIITINKSSGHSSWLPNIKYKLFYLANLTFDFIYLDCDMYILSDLSYLWDRRKDKPFISTWHQPNIPKHTDNTHQFMNSGLQIVSDNSFYNLDKMIDLGYRMNFKFKVKGTDQALLHHYFEEINYDYRHKDIGTDWNSCAGYAIVNIDSDLYCKARYQRYPDFYDVRINHYWNEFKPWLINCPIFNLYKNKYVNRITS